MDKDNSSTKYFDLNKTLTPVKFPNNNEKNKANELMEIKTRLNEIIEIIIKNHVKWETAQKRGASICTSIEIVKTKVLESKAEENTALNYYPEELKGNCEKLAIILRILEDIHKSSQQSKIQIMALKKLNKNPNEIFYKTWTLYNFSNLIEMLEESYRNEIENKKIITREIAHATNRSELVLHSSLWHYPKYVNSDFNMYFKFLELEIKK